MNKDNRFSGVLGGGEYDLLKKALWYYDDLEISVANTVHDNTKEDRKYNLLEIGIGSGITTAFVLDNLKNKENVKIFAVDNEEKMLNESKNRFADINNLHFIKSDIISYLRTLDDGNFDGCYTGYVIHNFDFETRKELFKELGRVIKKGGFFVNGDKIVVDDPEKQKEFYEKALKTFVEFDKVGRPDVREEWTKHYEEDELVRFTEKEQKGLLEENGFESVEFIFRELMDAVVVAKKN